MSYRSSGSTFASSLASDESYFGTLPIITLLEDAATYSQSVFEVCSKTMNDLQTVEQLKKDRGQPVDKDRMDERDILLRDFLGRIAAAQDELADMRNCNFVSLSLIWGNGGGESMSDAAEDMPLTRSSELIHKAFPIIVNLLASIERQVLALRENFDGRGNLRSVRLQSESADELLARLKSMLDVGSSDAVIRHRRAIHPCRGALQLIKGNDLGGIDRCLKKDLTAPELEKLSRSGLRGTYIFWKCDSCEFRIKYFVNKSCAASLLTNDEHLTFKNRKVCCSRAFLAMSHLEQREPRRISSSYGPARYTCLICALHPESARPGRNHTFSNRDDYAKHIEEAHIDDNKGPRFFLNKLRIDFEEGSTDKVRREMWIDENPATS
jgi:hypothetical protein